MPDTLIARFGNEAEAERALARLSSEVALRDSAVLTDGLAGSLTLDSLDLAPAERSACEARLKQGGFLLVAQAPNEGAASAARHLLDPASQPELLGPAAAPAAQQTVAEERIPLVEEELRIGKRQVARGGTRVHVYTIEEPAQEQVELFEEKTEVTRRPVDRRLTEQEVIDGGLLKERVFEVSEMREEAVVSKEAYVREEVVVTKTTEHRVQQINETLRRTEARTEQLQPSGEAIPPSR